MSRFVLRAALVGLALTTAACGSGDPDVADPATVAAAPTALPGAGRIPIGPAAWGVAIDSANESVWVSDPSRATVVALDRMGRIAFGDGFVWAAEMEGRLLQTDPSSNRVVGQADVDIQSRGIEVGLGAIWVAHQPGTVTRVPLPR